MTKTLHVSDDTKIELQTLKKYWGLRSESEVVDCLIQLHNQTEQFPRGFFEYLFQLKNRD